MNSDTERTVEEIRRKRWYHSYTVMGDGGWPAVYQFAGAWKHYVLFGADPANSAPMADIIAESDEVAVEAFEGLCRDLSGCRACEKIVTYRNIMKDDDDET